MSDPGDFRRDESDAARETQRGRLNSYADEDAPGDWRGQGWRGGGREDPRDRGTPFLAFLVAILLVAMVTVALIAVIRQQGSNQGPVERARIQAPTTPSGR